MIDKVDQSLAYTILNPSIQIFISYYLKWLSCFWLSLIFWHGGHLF